MAEYGDKKLRNLRYLHNCVVVVWGGGGNVLKKCSKCRNLTQTLAHVKKKVLTLQPNFPLPEQGYRVQSFRQISCTIFLPIPFLAHTPAQSLRLFVS